MRLRSPARRPGTTLLEVLAATAIFLLSLVAITELMGTATNVALDVQLQSRAARLCQSKLNEYVAGVESLSSGSGSGDFEEDPDWQWNADTTSEGTATNLYRVKVTVSRDSPTRGKIEVSMTQLVFDPQQRGSIGAATTTATTTTDAAATTTPAATTPATGGASGTTTPRTGGGATGGGGTRGGGTTGGGTKGGP